MPKKSSPKKVSKINIQKVAEERILDSKLLRPKDRFPYNLLLPLVFAALAAVSALGYLYYFSNPSKPESRNLDITLPSSPEFSLTEAIANTPEETPEVSLTQVEILTTPTGFLNVRKGPGTTFEKIGQVNPGETYILVSEDAAAGWYEIRLDDATTGWVTKQYARVKE